MVVGLMHANRGGSYSAGCLFVKYGPFSGTSTLAVSEAYIVGSGDSFVGIQSSVDGDFDGDGLTDVMLSGAMEPELAVFSGPLLGRYELSDATGTLDGLGGGAGIYVATIPDIDGDEDDELAVANGVYEAYLVLGPITGDLILDEVASAHYDHVRQGVRPGGDTNADGISEVVVSSSGGGDAVVVIFGADQTGTLAQEHAETRINGPSGSGLTTVSAGDVNADGYGDLVYDRLADDDEGYAAGAAYILLGPLSDGLDVETDATAKLTGTLYARAGEYLDSSGDVDGDGDDEVLIGAPNVNGGKHVYAGDGAAYVCDGPFSGVSPLDDCRVVMRGNEDALAGRALSGGGDVDGDGLADVLVGGPGDNENGEESGAAWLLLGASIP